MPRKTAKEYPTFGRDDLLSGADSGLSNGSGCDPGLNAEAKLAVFPPSPRTIREGRSDRISDSRLGLIMGDLANWKFPLPHSCVTRCSALYPPSFLEKISCLALVMGEFCDSGQGPGLDGMAKRREI